MEYVAFLVFLMSGQETVNLLLHVFFVIYYYLTHEAKMFLLQYSKFLFIFLLLFFPLLSNGLLNLWLSISKLIPGRIKSHIYLNHFLQLLQIISHLSEDFYVWISNTTMRLKLSIYKIKFFRNLKYICKFEFYIIIIIINLKNLTSFITF